jgi:hypothetical protein
MRVIIHPPVQDELKREEPSLLRRDRNCTTVHCALAMLIKEIEKGATGR